MKSLNGHMPSYIDHSDVNLRYDSQQALIRKCCQKRVQFDLIMTPWVESSNQYTVNTYLTRHGNFVLSNEIEVVSLQFPE